MEWQDQGILLSTRQFGESSVIINVFTQYFGRQSGIVRGGKSRKFSSVLQPGGQLDVMWKARLQEHIGTFQVELIRSRSAMAMSDKRALSGLNAVTGMLLAFLPEREKYDGLFSATEQLLDLLEYPEVWSMAYLKWELGLLDILGFGLDLSACTVTGQTHDLVFVSPKTGRAVSRKGAGKWADRLLPLPRVMLGQDSRNLAEIAQALEVSKYFFENHVCKTLGLKQLPLARSRFLDIFRN